jgi:hypothetical protein
MLKGDISNELPQRVLVVADVFLNTDVEVTKRFKIFSVQKINKTVRRELLSSLYLTTTRRGITLELVSFDLSEEQLAEVIDFLDKKGTNPFRYFMSYGSIDELIRELPYRPEVVGVLDIPNRLLRYGHWGLDFNSL